MAKIFDSIFPLTVALSCEGLSPPTNGGVNVQAGPNSLTYGLGSVATYSCDPGYALVGQRTRTCQDNNGGTVTMGTWSGGLSPLCQGTPGYIYTNTRQKRS